MFNNSPDLDAPHGDSPRLPLPRPQSSRRRRRDRCVCSTWASLDAVSAAFWENRPVGRRLALKKHLSLEHGPLPRTLAPQKLGTWQSWDFPKVGDSPLTEESRQSKACLTGRTVYPIAGAHALGRGCAWAWLSRKTPENGLLQPLPRWSQGRQAPQEEARRARDLESSSECDRPSHLALKIEGAMPPAFPVHLGQVRSALSEVALCDKCGRRHPPGLGERFGESQGCWLHRL